MFSLLAPSAPASAPSPAVFSKLVCPDGRTLPLRESTLVARACAGVSRTVVRQRFENPFDEALEVTYQLPLPAEGAVSGFRFVLESEEVAGEVHPVAEARARYQQALLEGRTAALLEQTRSNLFTQRVGNIPPRAALVAEITVDQKLLWAEGGWEYRFPTVVPPRYTNETVRDAAAVAVEVMENGTPQELTLALEVADSLAEGTRPASPSHPLRCEVEGDARTVRFDPRAGEPVRLDRDVVIRWRVAQPRVGVTLDVEPAPEGARDAGERYGLLTLVPPASASDVAAMPRDLVVLIDTSGSMSGRPLQQAAAVLAALIDTLTERDRLELLDFNSTVRRWKPEPVRCTRAARDEAMRWVRALSAGGGTEMLTALREALRPLRADAQRQVLLITDGYVGFENEMVQEVARRLPANSRLHALGVGSAVNRALTGPCARAGRGVEALVGYNDEPTEAARSLVARTNAPLVTELTVEGPGVLERAHGRSADLFGASPALLSVRLGAPGAKLVVRGRTAKGEFSYELTVPEARAEGRRAVRALYGRERVEELELTLAAGGDARDVDASIESLGVTFQLATRLTAWVAVSRKRTVDPEKGRRTVKQPQELPHGADALGLGLRGDASVESDEDEEFSVAAPAQAEKKPALKDRMRRAQAPADEAKAERKESDVLFSLKELYKVEESAKASAAPAPAAPAATRAGYAGPLPQSADAQAFSAPLAGAPMPPTYSASYSPETGVPAPARHKAGKGVFFVLFLLLVVMALVAWWTLRAPVAPSGGAQPAPSHAAPVRAPSGGR